MFKGGNSDLKLLLLLKKSGEDNISKKKVAPDGLTRIYLRHNCLSLKHRTNAVPKPEGEKGVHWQTPCI